MNLYDYLKELWLSSSKIAKKLTFTQDEAKNNCSKLLGTVNVYLTYT